MKTYEELNIYDATYEEVYNAVKLQYKNREHKGYNYETLTVGDWNEINKNIKEDLKEMGVKYQNAFYNPNNMRVYIKQKSWILKTNLFNTLTKEEQEEAIARYGSRKEAKKAWDEEKVNTSLDYCVATGTDLYYTEEDYFTVPAW